MHVWSQRRNAGQQMTLRGSWVRDPVLVTAKSVGICAPGEALIRHFFLEAANATKPYKLSWRQQNVPMTVGAVDATYKIGKELGLLKIRQTVFSNDVVAPAIAVWTSSASMDDPAFEAACSDYEHAA